ncbi:MAG: RNA polymerase sigma factor [Bacteroidota bacterium]
MTPQEIQQISHRFYPEFRPYALTLTRDEDRAADLLQEAIYLVLKNHERFTRGTNLQAWVKTIIRNVFITGYRKGKRRQEITDEQPLEGNWANQTTEYNPAESDLGAEEIMAQIEQLPEIYRRAFLLHYNGMKYKDIATITNVPIGTAKSRVWTARNLLRERVSRS